MNPIINQLMNHRSIRRFKDDAISVEVMASLLKAGQMASTSSYVQAYHVIRVEDKSLRQRVFDLSGEQKYILTAPEFLIFCADLHKLEVACDLHGVDMDKGYMESMIVATVDCAIMAQNVLTAAESMGLGGVYIGGIRNNIKEISRLLSLPDQVYPVFGMCLGVPDQDPGIKPRMPLELMVSTDAYQEIDTDILKAYDQDVSAYYVDRTKGKVNHTWTEQISDKMKTETRPFMKQYLNAQGLARK